ncbi:uncharacterized protein EKO05_0011255 [Ascochyta rabiei]|uniref:uncharacterized protein n=1 Tax=Didymella rabiei TaxID=5454 RepID=UPI0022088481|nr:uncharacterized protein EKO05_0011255 [Ascochyta rabiei]UPX21049.1 hypothetical protein EKO05_0011255 [Ascochyta rabiei]
MKLVGSIESEKNLLHLALTNNTGRLLHEVDANSRENTKQLAELLNLLKLQADVSQEMSLKLGDLGLSQLKLYSDVEARQERDEVLQNAQERKEILAWLSKADHDSSYQDAIQRRHDTTGKWFLESPEYILWKDTKGKTLFCPGMPGAGKTILASVVIADLYESYKSELFHGIAFLFNIFNEKQSSKELLASLLQQLVKRQEQLPVSITELYERHNNIQKPLPIQEIIKGIRAMVNSLRRVFLVVDALDECNTNSLGDLLSTIFMLRDECNINILATSRDIPTITSEFKGAGVLEISARDEDIQHFVRGNTKGNIVHRDPTLLDEAAVKIAQSAQGMFLLAKLHVDSLQFQRSKKAFRDALQRLASGSNPYDTAYEAAMERINGQTEEQAQFAREVLSWVTHAKRPLLALELCEALAMEDQVPALDPDSVPCLDDILSVCAGLLVVDEGSNKIRLVHYTAQDYFDRTSKLWFPSAELMVATTCITYLSLSVFSEPRPKYKSRYQLRDDQPLYSYAANYWAVHASLTDMKQIQSAIERLLKRPQAIRHALEQVFSGSILGATGLHLAVWSGLHDVVAIFLGLGCDPNAVLTLSPQNELESLTEQTPLTIAAKHGYTSIAELLISVGARMDTKLNGRSSKSPLETAASEGHESTIKLLIQGSSVRDVQLSLSPAIRKCSVSLCELLLERAPVEFDDMYELLDIAVSRGRKDLAYVLLEEHFSKNAQNQYGQTLLFRAAFNGNSGIVRQLLKASATVNVPDSNNQTPLHVAVHEGYAEVVKLLLHGGADLEFQDSRGRTVLYIAVSRCQEDIVNLLLDSGACVDILDGRSRTLLHLAAGRGDVSIVECILRKGISPNVQEDAGQTPLHTAAAGGDIETVQYMLSRGAKINIQDNAGCTAFWYACTNQHSGMANKLLDSGADWRIADNAGVSVIASARGVAYHRCQGIFERLENLNAILELMGKRRAEKALLASEQQSHVHTERDVV